MPSCLIITRKFNAKGSDDGVQHSEVLGFCPSFGILTISLYGAEHYSRAHR
jgi:hypothetical protein